MNARLLSIAATFCVFVTTFSTTLYARADDSSYGATVVNFAHGFLDVIDFQCHHHSLTSLPDSGLSMDSIRTWGWQRGGESVQISSHFDSEDRLEIVDQIHRSAGQNAAKKCTKETTSFGTHADGVITTWSEGNAAGGFTLKSASGATREFGFVTQDEPPIDGHKVFCESTDMPPGCPALMRLIHLNRTQVRVYYKIIDSPDGPAISVIRIQRLTGGP